MTAPRLHHLFDRAVDAHPARLALTDAGGGAVTYAGLAAQIRQARQALRDLGLRPGDRLLILAENATALPVLLLAASAMQAVAVPVSARLTGPELARITTHADPRLTICLSHVSDEARAHAHAAGARPVTLAGAALHVAGPFPASPEPAQTRMAAVILYTTGTTGAPKGVMLGHDNLIFGARMSARMRGIVPGDVIHGALPLSHVFGLTSMLCAGLSAGAHLRLMPRFSAASTLDALQQDITVLPAVPQMHAAIMAEARARGQDRLTGPLRYVSSGAAPLDPDWKRRAEAFYGLPLQNGYGMTETTAGTTLTRNAIGDPDLSVGPPLPGVQIRLDEAIGREPGTGEVLTRGPHVMRGYFRDPAATRQVLDDQGWLRSGDLGRIDAQGRLHIVGRCKELIIRGGFNVYPPEVEAALNDHPAVVQAAVIGRVIGRVVGGVAGGVQRGGDEEVLAFCHLVSPGAVNAGELAAHAAARLAAYKRPSRIILTGALPAASTGKVLKHRLLAQFADLLADPMDGQQDQSFSASR